MTNANETDTCPCCTDRLKLMAHDPTRIATHVIPGTDETCPASRASIRDSEPCEHESETTVDGHGAFCRLCGETLE